MKELTRKRTVLHWPRRVKQLVVMGIDVSLAVLAMWLAFSLRFDEPNWPATTGQWIAYGLAPLLVIPIFVRFGLYRAIFRYSSAAAFVTTVRAVALYALVLFAILVVLRLPLVPRSAGLTQPIFFLVLVGSSRAVARFLLSGLGESTLQSKERLLIYGAGETGAQAATALSASANFTVLGFIDDDISKIGRSINGLTVFAPSDVDRVVKANRITDILLALPRATRERRREIIESLRSLPVHTRTVPGIGDLATGRVTVQDFQELDIEDVLGRHPVAPDGALLAKNISGKTVLVTGAGGSIGSELCRQIALQRPEMLLLLDHAEFNLYAIHRELQALCEAAGVATRLVPLLASVGNATRIDQIFAAYKPQTVYHAAAYKHVPMVEHNAAEGVANNVVGTQIVASAAMAHGAANFVLVSTDKAVRPTNIMGATKRVAEMVLQAMSDSSSSDSTCFCMVRFGNVLDSSGSVVPLFRQQIASGGPVTVTHPEVTRYFMIIPEAAQLVIQAGAMASGGEVFVLDMGEPVRILDLAQRMIELSGRRVRSPEHPDGDVDIAIVGLRPGEKLYEELLIGDNPTPTSHPRIMKAREDFLPMSALNQKLADLSRAIAANDVVALRAILETVVSGYVTSSEIVDHVSRAN